MIPTIFSKLQHWRKILNWIFSLNHVDIMPLSLKCIASTSDAIFWCGTLVLLFPVVQPIKDLFDYKDGRRGIRCCVNPACEIHTTYANIFLSISVHIATQPKKSCLSSESASGNVVTPIAVGTLLYVAVFDLLYKAFRYHIADMDRQNKCRTFGYCD